MGFSFPLLPASWVVCGLPSNIPMFSSWSQTFGALLIRTDVVLVNFSLNRMIRLLVPGNLTARAHTCLGAGVGARLSQMARGLLERFSRVVRNLLNWSRVLRAIVRRVLAAARVLTAARLLTIGALV